MRGQGEITVLPRTLLVGASRRFRSRRRLARVVDEFALLATTIVAIAEHVVVDGFAVNTKTCGWRRRR